jgi:3-isopropylmalate/(R)-2-methylmalate dehydratase small subunit
VGLAGSEPTSFSIPARRREALLEGFDEIDLTFKHRAKIESYGSRDRELRPWIYRVDLDIQS